MTMIDQLTEHDRTELLARAQDAWERAPQNTMRAVFEWRGKNYVVSHSSVQLRIHTEEGIRERLGDLARDPLRGWVCPHAKRHPKSSSVAHNDKTIQNLECDVIAEKRPPALRRWPRVAAHVPSDRRLGDLEAELEQLTMNARRAPKCGSSRQ